MAREFAAAFYGSREWKDARAAYLRRVGYLCERCLASGIITPAEIVHHRTELTPENITRANIRTGSENLEAVCRECHAAAHDQRAKRKGFHVLDDGSVVICPPDRS